MVLLVLERVVAQVRWLEGFLTLCHTTFVRCAWMSKSADLFALTQVSVRVWVSSTRSLLLLLDWLLIDEVVLDLGMRALAIFLSRAEVSWNYDYVVDCRNHWLNVILFIWVY